MWRMQATLELYCVAETLLLLSVQTTSLPLIQNGIVFTKLEGSSAMWVGSVGARFGSDETESTCIQWGIGIGKFAHVRHVYNTLQHLVSWLKARQSNGC